MPPALRNCAIFSLSAGSFSLFCGGRTARTPGCAIPSRHLLEVLATVQLSSVKARDRAIKLGRGTTGLGKWGEVLRNRFKVQTKKTQKTRKKFWNKANTEIVYHYVVVK